MPDQSVESHIGFYNGRTVNVTGVVREEPDVRVDHQRLTIGELRISGRDISGRLLATTNTLHDYQYGDMISVRCALEAPERFDAFAYDRYLARFHIYSLCRNGSLERVGTGRGNVIMRVLLLAKQHFLDTINAMLSEPHASFLSALLIGARRGIPSTITEAFNRTGTTHIVAISGSNITIIAAIIVRLVQLVGIGRRSAFWWVSIAIGAFVLFAGATASVVRAGIMAFVVLLARQLGRPSRALNVMVLAATSMTVINPLILLYDAGFQLSFLATIGLVYVNPLTDQLFARLPNVFGIRDMLSTTLAAMATTTPLILYQFGRISLIAPIANIAVLPFIPLIMAFGFAMVFLAMLVPPLGVVVSWPTWLMLEGLLSAIVWMSHLPFASFTIVPFHWSVMVGLYVVLWYVLRRFSRTKHTYDAQTI